MKLEPGFGIYHPGLLKIFNHVKSISPILSTDRYTVPEYQEIKKFIESGELWDMMLNNMTDEFLKVEIPQEYLQTINTNPLY